MIRLILSLAMVFSAVNSSVAADRRSEVLKTEFATILGHVKAQKADGKIGDFMKFKKMGNYLLLWDLGPTADDYDLIRLYNEHDDGSPNFSVSYYRSKNIVEGRTVIRRFVGPDTLGWRNDTMDYETGEYLGMQGTEEPSMSASDRRILKDWNIELFD